MFSESFLVMTWNGCCIFMRYDGDIEKDGMMIWMALILFFLSVRKIVSMDLVSMLVSIWVFFLFSHSEEERGRELMATEVLLSIHAGRTEAQCALVMDRSDW